MFEPKFEINGAIAQALMRIEAAKEAVSILPMTPKLQAKLRETARLLSTHYSTQIEGNKLDEKAVTTLIGSKPVKNRDKDSKEILNYQNALSYAETLAQEKKLPSIRDFCDLQKLVTQDFIQKNQIAI